MNDDHPLARFCSYILQNNSIGDLSSEVLRHEMTATLNRNRLTQKEEGINSFNTLQLSWLVSSNPHWQKEHVIVVALLLSALIDDDIALFREAQANDLIPAEWTWVAWADGFAADETTLREHLSSVADPRQRCGAVSLATRTCPDAIGCNLLADFCDPSLAVVYHRLLARALSGPRKESIAASELERLGAHLEVLFVTDTDSTIAALVAASDLDHPEFSVSRYKDATGDLTRVAIARRHLERGRARDTLNLIKDLRFLSPAYDQAILIAALSALECGEMEMACNFTRCISDAETRLKVQTRLAQATGDAAAEIDALNTLYRLCPHQAEVFVQLVNVLDRVNRPDLARGICFEAQERFVNDKMVERIIRQHLATR